MDRQENRLEVQSTCPEITLYPVLSSRTVLTALVLSALVLSDQDRDQDRVQHSAPDFIPKVQS